MPTPTPKLPRRLRRAALLLPLLCLSWLAQAQNPYFSAGTLSYETTGTDNRAVRFRVQLSSSNIGKARPALGQVVGVSATLDFGDGTALQNVNLTATRLGSDDFTGEATIAHAYATTGSYTATVRAANRISRVELVFSTVVGVGAANDSPVAAVGPIVVLTKGPQAATYQVAASDPNGDALTYSLVPAAETNDFSNPPGLSINPNTGLLRFNSASPAYTFSFLTAVVRVSDGKSSIVVDQLVQLLENAPVFTAPTPANGQVFTTQPGQTVTFTVRAVDAEASSILLDAATVPPGAAFTPALPLSGNPVQSTFSWTPTAANIGSYTIGLIARNPSVPIQTNSFVTIRVAAAPVCDPLANRPVANADRFTASCGPLTIKEGQLLGNDTDPLRRLLNVSTVGSPTNGTLVQNGATYTFTPTPGFTGTASFTYQVLVSGGGLSYPSIASPATGHYYEFFTSPGICWREAQRQAALRSYNGLQGYLATITSAEEAALLSASYPSKDNSKSYWFGASDEAVEGEWRWKAGPEAGQLFWRGAANGTAVGFSNWTPGEPNDYKNQYRPAGEDFGLFYGSSGLWNDVDECNTGASTFGYVIEYGGLEACTPVLYATGTVTIEVAAPTPPPVANPDQFSTPANTPLVIRGSQLRANDTDPLPTGPLEVLSVGGVRNGMVVAEPNEDFTFTPAPGFTGTASFTYQVVRRAPRAAGTPLRYSAATGHYYEYMYAPDICWDNALANAATYTFNGLRGYLATITSAAEADAVKMGDSSGRFWLGASDEAVEGEWRWKTGPEAGQLFWRGAANGTAVGFSNWLPGQPDDFQNQYRPAGEDYAFLYGGSGLWNDYSQCVVPGPDSYRYLTGYLVEYGGLETCLPNIQATGTVTINVGAATQNAVLAAKAPAGTKASAGAKALLEAAPNPSGGQFRLRVTAATDGAAQLDVYDLQGRRVKAVFAGQLRAGQVREVPVEASELAAGVYLVRLQSGPQVQHLRIVVQK